MTVTLHELSTELLIKIFCYLNIPDLCKLKQTCRRFNEIITSWDHVLLKTLAPLVTNQKSNIFLSRCFNQLSTLEKIRISKNWQIGRYQEKSLLYVKRKYIPWLYLSKKSVWISRGNKIFSYERHKSHVNVSKPGVILKGRSNADVGNFQLKNDLLISGQRDGNLCLWCLKENKAIFDTKNCHNSDINSVDISLCGSIIASGSRDNCLKIWRLNYDSLDGLEELHCHNLQDRVWRVSLLNEKPLLAVGTSGNNYKNSLFVYDVERISDPIELPSTNLGLGVLDIRWDSPSTLWSCGYDTYLKRWDLRTGRCEQIFRDPHASALYCLDYDYCNTIMTGTQMHGRENHHSTLNQLAFEFNMTASTVHKIMKKAKYHPYKLYFMDSCKNGAHRRSSPIYSLSFDSECLFTVTDQNLNVLNFSVYNGNVNDYSVCWSHNKISSRDQLFVLYYSSSISPFKTATVLAHRAAQTAADGAADSSVSRRELHCAFVGCRLQVAPAVNHSSHTSEKFIDQAEDEDVKAKGLPSAQLISVSTSEVISHFGISFGSKYTNLHKVPPISIPNQGIAENP
ncbi:hypothetical protein NQ318_014672, partial [Aromia moschata]